LPELEYRPLVPEAPDLARLAACFAANGDPKDLGVLDWQYRDNPVTAGGGGSFVDLALERGTDRVGAVYATFPVTFQLGGQRTVGVQSLDTLTDADHRGKGLFTRMAAGVYDRCAEHGVALVYGFPNASSAPGFFGKLGWTRLNPVPFVALPLRTRFFLRRFGVPSRVTRWVPDRAPLRGRPPLLGSDEEVAVAHLLGPEVDELWARFGEQVRIAVVRDRSYLAWRLARPGGGYRVLAFRRGGELRGLAVVTVKDKHGGRVGYVMELLHVPEDPRAGEVLLHAVVDECEREGADLVLAWSFDHAPNHRAFHRVGFRSLPEALRPIELHFGARALAAPPDAAIGNRRNWYLSYLDSDTV
jgi:GNAT superfamily N-acetyltransferase